MPTAPDARSEAVATLTNIANDNLGECARLAGDPESARSFYERFLAVETSALGARAARLPGACPASPGARAPSTR